MKLDRLTPMLWTNHIKASIEFYQTILGFELDEYNEEWKWCHMHKNKVNLMFVHRDAPSENFDGVIKFTGSFYFYTEEVDELWNALKTNTEVCYELGNFAHSMREFGVYDNNGYLLQFGRELKEAEVIDECD